MPIYAYSCRDCGRSFDIRQEFSDASLTVCDACGGTLRKQFGSIGVTFNGPGFYRTDSRPSSTSSTKPTKNESSSGASGSSDSSTATSTKTAASATSSSGSTGSE
ncbi:MAG TPA: FmdB family transcriptional regulator [Candidatus Agrococcus pullicola]|uniref:FmdB family transcriptional regulator n=1 Tax=Candidatus Agrococcus pullicola TaxID=2838429 RepID=A0A9D2C9N0_9MICO|nr:FmdB family transcriptional regulator [Candidatus Agrococcus pullicola]